MKEIYKVREKVDMGVYENDWNYPVKEFSDDHIFDEDKSVKWNRDELIKQTQEHEDYCVSYKDRSRELENMFAYDLESAIALTLPDKFELETRKKAAEFIYKHAYIEGHAYGEGEIISQTYVAIDLVSQVLEALEV